jgi:integrase
MARVNFTAPRVESYKCDDGKAQSILWDSAAPGLGLRATAGGKKQYIFQAKIRGLGIDPRIPIGDAAAWRLPEAREQARQYKLMTDKGLDPREVMAAKRTEDQAATAAQARATARESITLGDVWPTYIEDRKPKWSEGHLRNHISLASAGGEKKKRGKGLTVAGPLASLMTTRLSELTSDRIATWLDEEAATRATNAAQSFRILRAFIRWADDQADYSGIIPPRAYDSRKVRDVVPKSETKEGDSLQREQLKLWFKGVSQLTNPYRAAYLQALLLTGARRTELTELRWADVDFQWKTMTISDKVEDTRTIPLPPYLAHILSSLPRENEWVFYSPQAASGHLEEPKDAHAKALKAVGLPHLSIHGLRRSFGTLAEWLDVPVGVVAQINGHKPSAIAEKHYRRRPIDILRMHHERIEAWILEEAGIKWSN